MCRFCEAQRCDKVDPVVVITVSFKFRENNKLVVDELYLIRCLQPKLRR